MTGQRTQLAEIREARRILQRIRDRLVRPSFQAVSQSAEELQWVADGIGRLDSTSAAWQGGQRKTLEAEVIGLRQDIQCLTALLKNAGRFYAGWVSLLSFDVAPPNYTPVGSANLCSTTAQTTRVVIHG
jgi:hypothetical protein